VLVASFFLTMLAAMDTRLETLANFSPFSYYQGGLAINGMQWSWLAGLLGGSLVFMLIAWWLFQRREIRVGGERSWRVPGLPLGSRD
jgi:ABC-2 type transport system permease protein